MKHFTWLLGSLSLALALCGCELNDPISNGDLDAWCGDTPCGWEDEGDIKRVSTWHANDYAVSFERKGARLSQLNAELNSVECLSFSMVARVSHADVAFVELDFLDDGIIDWKRPIPPGDFRELEFNVYAPSWYEGVRFIVRRGEGNGEVVLASIHAKSYGECRGEQLELDNLPGGAPCEVDEACATRDCHGGQCVGCESDDDCDDGKACGYALADSDYFSSLNLLPLCVEPGTQLIGALCVGDAECESGVCCEGACSECCGADGCDGERTCTRALAGDRDGGEVLEPFLCSAGEETGQDGDACTSDEECEGDCVDRACTGFCLDQLLIGPRCAMLECTESSCDYNTCQVETVEVGTCD